MYPVLSRAHLPTSAEHLSPPEVSETVGEGVLVPCSLMTVFEYRHRHCDGKWVDSVYSYRLFLHGFGEVCLEIPIALTSGQLKSFPRKNIR